MKKSDLLLVVALACVAATLRAPITAVGSLIRLIQADVQVSNAIIGLLTTIPLLMFALISPLVAIFNKHFGTGQILLGSMFVMIFGILIRSYFRIAGLFIGTIILGIAITVGNVLIPAIIKSRLHNHMGLATGVYITSLQAFAGLSSGISLPLSRLPGMDWQRTLSVWVILLAISIIIWYPQRSIRLSNAPSSTREGKKINVIKSPLAWSVTIFMAMQSFIFYFMVAWLPSVLNSLGLSFEIAGYYALGYQIMSIPSAFLIPQFAAKKPNQRGILITISLIYLLGIMILLFAKNPVILFAATLICGFSTGASFGMTMLLIPLRSSDATTSTKLSGMVQSAGYAFAAIGPILMGRVFDITKSWVLPLGLLLTFTIVMLISGLYCGQDKTI